MSNDNDNNQDYDKKFEELTNSFANDNNIVKSDKKNDNDYFDDDAVFLSEDNIISQEDRLTIIEQLDNVISWRIDNFYDDDDNPYSKRKLKSDPPVLRLEKSDGDFAEFMITEDFANSLSHLFNSIDKAYKGYSPKKDKRVLNQENVKNDFELYKNWVKVNPVKTGVGVILILLVIALLFFG